MITRTHDTYTEALQRIARDYIVETGCESYTTKELAIWAIRTRRWEAPSDLLVRKCREDFARALRQELICNQHGQTVRANHVARITRGDKQLHLWADIRNAPHEHIELAFDQRRKQIVGDCRQMARDADYYHSLHPDRPRIQQVWDFTEDVEEGRFPTTYPPQKSSIGNPSKRMEAESVEAKGKG